MMKKVIVALAILTGFMANAQSPVPGVTVSGEGTVYVNPDQVVVNFGVENKGDFVKEVKSQTETAVDKILKFLDKAGIESKDIQTQYVRLNKVYDYQTKVYEYSSSQSISVKIVDIEKYEEIITGLMEAGVNQISNVTFGSSKVEEYETQARIKAVQNAKKKASEYAEALGQKIGKAMIITDAQNTRVFTPRLAFKVQTEADVSDEKDFLAPGQLAVSANVRVTFTLN